MLPHDEIILLTFPHPLILVERPDDPRSNDGRYSRDYDNCRGGSRGVRYDNHNGGGWNCDRPRDYASIMTWETVTTGLWSR